MRIFLSFAFGHGEALTRAVERLLASHGVLASALTLALRNFGFEVLNEGEGADGLPMDLAITSLMERTDLLVVLVSGSLNRWAMLEIEEAVRRKVPIKPVLVGTPLSLPNSLESFEPITIEKVEDLERLAPSLAQQIRESIDG